ncbi:Transposable element P transposase [Amphibalanus amphitrite]|uniref:Transposable element P transposase n=1 Tax=Amphibalanus amphitrite TaxID=1232801 RepID=A0A6A4V4W5_AMPAM|nr:Transposable element P transposase [Amphibalanus amphitrite]
MSLHMKICYPELSKFKSQPTQWGCKHEQKGLSAYNALQEEKHKAWELQACGLFIDKEHGFLAATPDSLVTCSCCGNGVVEVKDIIEGFEDMGGLGRTGRVTTQALVFMARGLTNRWKLPIGYTLHSGPASARVMEPLLMSAVRQLRNAGLTVVSTVCDMGKPNQELYRLLGVTETSPQFDVDGTPVMALHNVPHIFKCVRNGLLKHDVEVDGETLSWSHIKAFYNADKDRPIRTAPKLGPEHVQPDAFKKMSVRLAAQIMSASTSAGMRIYQSFDRALSARLTSHGKNARLSFY